MRYYTSYLRNSFVRGVAILLGTIGFGTVILVHECGHYLMCKLYGVAAPLFSIGFGPTLAGIEWGGTLFQFRLLPIGGLVTIDPTDLAAQSYLTQVTIMGGGIAANFAAALIIFALIARAKRYTALLHIESVQPNSPACHAGLRSNDILAAFDSTPLKTVHDLLENIINHAGQTVTLTIVRDGQTIQKSVPIAQDHPTFGKQHGWLGIQLGYSTENTSVYETIRSSMNGLFKKRSIVGARGTIHLISKSIAMGPRFFFLLLGTLNLGIGLIRALPLPFLDGGKIVGITLERWTCTPGVDNYISFISFFIIILLLITLRFHDIRGIIKRT